MSGPNFEIVEDGPPIRGGQVLQGILEDETLKPVGLKIEIRIAVPVAGAHKDQILKLAESLINDLVEGKLK